MEQIFDWFEGRLAADVRSVRFDPPASTYLGWFDFRATGLGDDPAEPLLERFGVALSSGPKFGASGPGSLGSTSPRPTRSSTR